MNKLKETKTQVGTKLTVIWKKSNIIPWWKVYNIWPALQIWVLSHILVILSLSQILSFWDTKTRGQAFLNGVSCEKIGPMSNGQYDG